ncbi:MAG TPA: RyR domain-containing protein [Anaerolineaceae bacterium]|nr:RyR domain-containing protein [Anaerolineaceae bacterium]
MKTLQNYVQDFFALLNSTRETEAEQRFTNAIKMALLTFLDDESKENAATVYDIFFSTYRIVLEGSKSTFIDLLDVLSAYEERAATLIDKQRDHYIHSVNVFILGLCIYSQNSNFRTAFKKANIDGDKYPENYPNEQEEFLFRWGIAALFHDVGYPIEIIGKQIESFLEFATNADHADSKGKIKAHLEFQNFRHLNSVAEVTPKKVFIKDFYEQNESSVYIDLLQPIDLLAQKIHLSLAIPLDEIKNKLDSFVLDMAKFGFIDHGFYSAIIVLKWYGYLIQKTNMNPMRFYNAVVDSASAILLHNYYRNACQKSFGCGPMNPVNHPIAYLLMFCDEMQDWNRAGYGKIEKTRTQAASAKIFIDEKNFGITYLAGKGTFSRKFIDDKNELFNQLLDIRAVFPGGLHIECDTLEVIFKEAREDVLVPRPMLENMELLAKAIHEDYIAARKKRNEPIRVAEKFEDLDDSARYSNLRQAMNIGKKLQKVGYVLVSQDADGQEITQLDDDTIEQYAILEHDDWMEGKIKDGWSYASTRDDSQKKHNCLVPWSQLSEMYKEYDRDVARNVIRLAAMVDMKVIKA